MTSSLPLTFPGGAGGSWVKGCRQQGSEHLRLWHLGAPSVEAPGQEEDTNTDGHRLQTGAVHTRHGSKQACRASEGLACAWGSQPRGAEPTVPCDPSPQPADPGLTQDNGFQEGN